MHGTKTLSSCATMTGFNSDFKSRQYMIEELKKKKKGGEETRQQALPFTIWIQSWVFNSVRAAFSNIKSKPKTLLGLDFKNDLLSIKIYSNCYKRIFFSQSEHIEFRLFTINLRSYFTSAKIIIK